MEEALSRVKVMGQLEVKVLSSSILLMCQLASLADAGGAMYSASTVTVEETTTECCLVGLQEIRRENYG